MVICPTFLELLYKKAPSSESLAEGVVLFILSAS